MREGVPRLQFMFSVFLAMVTAIVVVFLAQLVLDIKAELGDIRKSISAIRAESASRVAAEPFKVLEEKCVGCHSERRFLGVHGTSFELKKIIEKMQALPDVRITAQDRDKIHASLELLKCVRCHDDATLKKLASRGPEAQRAIIEKMAAKPEAKIPPEEAEQILRAYQKIQGY